MGNGSINLAVVDRAVAEFALAELAGVGRRAQVDRDVLRLYMENAAEAIPGVVTRLRQANINPISLTLTQPTLDDVFLQVTGQRLRDESAAPAPAPTAKAGRR